MYYLLAGNLAWSKLESGRLPSLEEVKSFLVQDYQFEGVSVPNTASS